MSVLTRERPPGEGEFNVNIGVDIAHHPLKPPRVARAVVEIDKGLNGRNPVQKCRDKDADFDNAGLEIEWRARHRVRKVSRVRPRL